MPKTKSPLSERRLAANRANAQKSTGPKSAEGKARSALNALKTGLTGQTVLLPTDEVEAYQAHHQRLMAAFGPVGPLEEQVVQTLADLQWRLGRIPSLESGSLALARRRLDPALFADELDPAVRAVLVEAHAQEAAAPALERLHRQEQRLRRQYAQEHQELRRLQAERHAAARQREQQRLWQEALQQICDCPDESCPKRLEALLDSFAPASWRKQKGAWGSPTPTSPAHPLPPRVLIVDDRHPSPTSA